MQAQDTRRIPLLNRLGTLVAFAIIDAADFDALSQRRWHLDPKGYAQSKKDAMHRVVLGLQHGDGLESDHINRDKLDNRRANLRIVSRAANARNMGPRSGRRYCGIYFDRGKQRWRAAIIVDKKRHHIGWFRTEDEAGQAADAWSRVHLPERWQVP